MLSIHEDIKMQYSKLAKYLKTDVCTFHLIQQGKFQTLHELLVKQEDQNSAHYYLNHYYILIDNNGIFHKEDHKLLDSQLLFKL